MINSKLLGFECRVSQPYNLPTHELTRFVNGVEFTNCFRLDTGLYLVEQLIDNSQPVFQMCVAKLLFVLQFQQQGNLAQCYHRQQVLVVAVGIHLAIALRLRINQLCRSAELVLFVGGYLEFIGPVKYMYGCRYLIHSVLLVRFCRSVLAWQFHCPAFNSAEFINAKLLSMLRISRLI